MVEVSAYGNITAAIARAQAIKLASTEGAKITPASNGKVLIEEIDGVSEAQTKLQKQALIAEAIARAKAKKLAATEAGVMPKNTENVSASVQAEIDAIDYIRKQAAKAASAKTTNK